MSNYLTEAIRRISRVYPELKKKTPQTRNMLVTSEELIRRIIYNNILYPPQENVHTVRHLDTLHSTDKRLEKRV